MKLFVLDIDGTLTNSEFQHQLAYVEAMRELGIKDVNTNWKTYAHMTDSYILKVNYERNFNQTFNLEFIKEFEEVMTLKILELKTVNEISGAQEFILQLQKREDLGFCFATGSFLKPALYKLNQAGIPMVNELVVGSNHKFSREEIVAASIEQAKQYYNVSSFQKIISIGDGIWDWKTAKNLGLSFIGIGEKNLSDFQSKGLPLIVKDWKHFDFDLAMQNYGADDE